MFRSRSQILRPWSLAKAQANLQIVFRSALPSVTAILVIGSAPELRTTFRSDMTYLM